MRGKPTKPQITLVAPTEPVLSMECTCDQALLDVTCSRHNPDTYEVSIFPLDSLRAGPFEFDIRLKARFRNGQNVESNIPVTGTIQQPVYAVPDSLVLGHRRITEVVQEALVLRAHDDQEFDVISVETVPDNVQVAPLPTAAPKGKGFMMSLRIAEPGTHKGQIRFWVKMMSSSEHFDVAVPFVYYALHK
jgi:hypothetical protein